MGFKTVTPEKIQQHVDFLRLSDKDPVEQSNCFVARQSK